MEQNFVNGLIENPWIGALLIVTLPLIFVVIYALIAILGEIKIASFVQERLGYMRTGWKGTMQPIAEVVKLLQKEDITPDVADKPLFNLAPFLMFTGAFAGFAVIPFSPYFLPSGIELGLFYVLAISSIAVIGLVMGGWASNNKYSLLGAMRSAAQIVSYEIPAALAILSIAVLSSTLNLNVISENQSGWFWNWYIFGGPGDWSKIWVIPFTVGLALIYLVATLAETNGYHTEYSGMKFAMFFFAEYANMFVVAAIIALLFFGGWNSPFGDFMNWWWMQPIWFILKSFFWVFVAIWLRWTLPRLRVDQLMYVSWKVLVPWAFLCFFAIGIFVMLK